MLAAATFGMDRGMQGGLSICLSESKEKVKPSLPSHYLMSCPVPKQKCAPFVLPCLFSAGCNGLRPGAPYKGFDAIIVFLDNIAIQDPRQIIFGGGRQGAGVNEGRVNLELEKINDYANFDSLVLFFYAADTAKGISCGDKKFDLHFATWLINRIYYWLSKKLDTKNACNVYGAPTDCGSTSLPNSAILAQCAPSKKEHEIDLICLGNPWDQYTYDVAAASNILNELATNTVLRPFVIRFISLLLKQLNASWEKYNGCCKKTGGSDTTYTTFALFYDITRLELSAFLALVERNYLIKYNYLAPKLYASFATVMYVYNSVPTGATSPVTIYNRTAFVVTKPPQLNISKIIELS